MTSDPLPAADRPVSSAGERLSLMMLLQYAVWGIWLPIVGRFLTAPVADGGLGFTLAQMGWVLGLAGSIGALAAPFIAGQLADRVMNAERALGLLLVTGGVVKWLTAHQTGYVPWLLLSIAYSVLYMPTLALTNSVAFANLRRPERTFPFVRSFGTIGWIVASVAFPLVYMKTDLRLVGYFPFVDGVARPDEIGQIRAAIVVSGVLSILYGLFCLLALPSTPPRPDARRPLAFAAAFRLLTRPAFLAVLLAAVLISMVHQIYFMRTGNYLTEHLGLPSGDIASSMAIGQVSEIVVLAIFGLVLSRLGYKWVLVLGALSFAARYAMFAATQSPEVMRLAMLLHGLNYGFFFAGSFMLVDRVSPPDIRHSAQTVYGMMILGIGPILAGFYNTALGSLFTRVQGDASVTDYPGLWTTQAAIGALAMLIVLLGYRERRTEAS